MSDEKSLPDDVIKLWPEVFSDIELNVVPLYYVQSIEISFHNKKTWEIDLEKTLLTKTWEEFETDLQALLDEYIEEIDTLDFKLDTDRIKTDMCALTSVFLGDNNLE